MTMTTANMALQLTPNFKSIKGKRTKMASTCKEMCAGKGKQKRKGMMAEEKMEMKCGGKVKKMKCGGKVKKK